MDEATRRAWASRVKAAREAQGLTKEELARMSRAGGATVTSRTLRDMENGVKTPHLETLLAVLDALGLDPDADPQVDADVEALTTLVGSLVKRLPDRVRVERAEQIAEHIAAVIRNAAVGVSGGGEPDDSDGTDQREVPPPGGSVAADGEPAEEAGDPVVDPRRRRTSHGRSKVSRKTSEVGEAGL